MTGAEHYGEAERLLEHASTMLDTDVHPADRAELLVRQAVIVAMAHPHAALADAAVTGPSGPLAGCLQDLGFHTCRATRRKLPPMMAAMSAAG